MALDIDYAAARRDGYSDLDILQGLQSSGKLDFDVARALKDGHSATDILQSILPTMPTQAPTAAPSSIMRRAGDLGISALKGAISIPEIAIGAADIATMGLAGKGLEAIGVRTKDAKNALNELYSPEQKAANQRVADAKGFVDTAGTMLSNPSTIMQAGVESIPSMLAGGLIGRGVVAVAPRIGAIGSAAIGEGVVGAGQAAEQIRQQNPDGTLSLGQSAAALASGVGTGAFGLVGGRIAQKLGIADIDTALVQAGSPVGSSKGVARRLLEGGISEGVFEEMPQSFQEKIWQNAAMDKPLLEGVPENAAQGLLVGGLFGGIAGLRGRPFDVQEDQGQGQPLLLTNKPDPFLSFPDGSVGRQSDADAFIASLPEGERNAARARLFGYESQPVTPEDVMRSQSVDEAIDVFNRSVEEGTPEFKAQKEADIDAAWGQYLSERANEWQQSYAAAEQARRDADVPAMAAQLQDQAVDQANALTTAQGFDEQQPTALQLAFQKAQAARQERIAEVQQRATVQAQPQNIGEQNGRSANDSAEVVAGVDTGSGTNAVAVGNLGNNQVDAGVDTKNGGTASETAVGIVDSNTTQPAPVGGDTRGSGAGAGISVQDAGTVGGKSSADTNTGAASTKAIERAKSILTAAGVTGNERMAALRAIRSGENTLDDLIDAHPPKGKSNDAAPAANSVQVSNEGAAGVATDSQEQPPAASALQATSQPAAQQSSDTTATGLAGGVGVSGADSTGGRSAALSKVSGERIDREWTRFAMESGTLDIERSQMPQVRAEYRGAMVNYLNARGITHETTEVPAGDLKPTQREYSPEKVQKARDYQGGDRSILISSDNHVLDGHHQWLAKLDAGEPVKVIRLNAPISELLEQVKDFPSSTVANSSTTESIRSQNERVVERKQGTGARADFASVERQQSRLESEIAKANENAAARKANQGEGSDTRIERELSELLDPENPRNSVTIGKDEEIPDSVMRAQTNRRKNPGYDMDVKPDGTTVLTKSKQGESTPRKSESPARGGMRAEDVTRSLTMLRAKWLGSNKVGTVQSVADLPADVRERSQADDKTEGLYDPKTGQVYLVADNISDPARAAWTAAHEIIGHGGLRALKDKTINEALNLAGANKFIKDLAAAIQQDRSTASAEIEEAVSELAAAIETDGFQSLKNRYGVEVPTSARNGLRGTIARVLDAIKRFLAAAIGKPVSSVSDADVRALIGAQREAVSQDDAGRSFDGGPVMASTNIDQTETAAFKRWFGDSKVVDENGKPRVMYHATFRDFSEFRTGGELGAHFGTVEQANALADEPGSRLIPVYLSIENPIHLEDKGTFRSEKVVPQLIEKGILPSGAKAADYLAADGIRESADGTRRLQEAITKVGYDGVVYRNTQEGDGESYIAFKPEQIKSAIGNNGNFDPNNASILQSRAPDSGAWDIPGLTKFDDLIHAMQDKQIDMKRIVSSIRASGKAIADAFNPYLQEELFYGRSAKGVKDFLDAELRPLAQDMQMRGVDMSDFEEFLWNRHAEERNDQIAKINDQMPDGGSGIKTADARKYLAALTPQKRSAYDALAKRIDAINTKTRGILVSSGLEKQETINAWDGAYDHYVPLQREDVETGGNGTGQGFSIRGSASKRATGSNKPVANIIANIAMQRERTIVRAEKNRVSAALLGLAKENPNADFWDVDNAPTERVVQEIGGQDKVVERIAPGFKSQDNVVLARINGEDHFIAFNEKEPRAVRMARSIKNLDADQLGRVLSATAKGTRYLAAINTQYNPIFGIINLMRDTQGAVLNLSTTPIAGDQKKVLGYTASALAGIYSDLRAHRAGKQPTSAWATLFEEFQNEGGQTGYRDQYANADQRAEAIAKEIKSIDRHPALKVGGAMFDWLSDYNESMENAVRLASYRAAKESGMSNQQAASLAKNLTVNFNRKGQVATQVGALYAFFNASTQGTARLAETLTGPMGKKIITGGILLGAMQAMLLAASDMGEDEPPEFVRSRSLILPIGDKKYLTLPMPLGFHALPNLGRIPMEFMLNGFRNPTKRVADLVGVFADTFNPIGNAGISLQTIAPSLVDPLAALAENRDWTGKQIARGDMNSMSPTPGYTRANDTATWWSKGIAYGLNILSGGTDYKQGLISPTPDQLDYLIGQAFGGVGREISKFDQVRSSMMTGEDLPIYKIPLVGRFVGNASGQAAESGKFYSAIKRINGHDAEITGLREDHKAAEARQYISENREALLVPLARKTEYELRKLKRAKREALDAGRSEQVKMIETRIAATMAQFNKRVDNYRDQ